MRGLLEKVASHLRQLSKEQILAHLKMTVMKEMPLLKLPRFLPLLLLLLLPPDLLLLPQPLLLPLPTARPAANCAWQWLRQRANTWGEFHPGAKYVCKLIG